MAAVQTAVVSARARARVRVRALRRTYWNAQYEAQSWLVRTLAPDVWRSYTSALECIAFRDEHIRMLRTREREYRSTISDLLRQRDNLLRALAHVQDKDA